MKFYRNGGFTSDPWAAPTPTGIILSPEQMADRDPNAIVGLQLDPGFDVESLAGSLEGVELIKIAFPKFTDGRGYSMAWLLRTRLAYRHELRAIGDILFDEMQFMLRCGFDSFEITDPSTLKLLEDGRRASFERFYQPGLEPEVPEGTRPWARRLAPAENGNLA